MLKIKYYSVNRLNKFEFLEGYSEMTHMIEIGITLVWNSWNGGELGHREIYRLWGWEKNSEER